MSGPPRLSVSTGAVPSTLGRKPGGARKRQGLFVANPDNSDSEGGSPSNTTSSSTLNLAKSIPIPLPTPTPTGIPSPSTSTHIPSVPAPNTPVYTSPQTTPPPLSTTNSQSSIHPPPRPPPQPERHYRRAYTTPVVSTEQSPPPRESRHASVSTGQPSSPSSRHLPNIPTQSPNSARSMPLPSIPQLPTPHTPLYDHPEASSSRSNLPYLSKANSPEDAISPAGQSERGSINTLGSGDSFGRPRSGSAHSHKVLLQVTMDNEQFTLVDVTGMSSAEAILDRVYSKLRFRDEEHTTLTLYRTEIGEAPEADPISKDALLQICQEQGDAKATLKFLVLQTKIPGSSASIVPPVQLPSPQGKTLPPINTTVQRNSKDGSLSSASGSQEWSDLGRTTYSSLDRRLPSASSSSRSLHDSVPRSHTSSPRSFVNIEQPVAGPSRYTPDDQTLFVDDDMDPATRALIEQMQREDEEARVQADLRQRQLEEDEKLARDQQRQERDVWQAMQQLQLEQRRQQQEQIEQDEQRAREFEAEERRNEEQRQYEERRYEEEHERSRRDSARNVANDRRALRQEWQHNGQDGNFTLPALGDSPVSLYSDRPPDSAYQSAYNSPVNTYDPRRPDQRNDYRIQPGMTMPRRQQNPYEVGGSLQNARSVENLRPFNRQQPNPPRTPQPDYRSQDGRYPEPVRPLRNPPHPGSIAFPNPRPGRQESSESSYFTYGPDNRESSRSNAYESPEPSSSTLPPRRPTTLYDNSPPRTAQGGYFPPGAQAPYYSSSRRGSLDPTARGKTPMEEALRRASESSAGDARERLTGTSLKPRTDTSDSISNSGTVSSGFSESTIRPEDMDTARGGSDLQKQWKAMISNGTIRPSESAVDDDEPEATLWLPVRQSPVPYRPNLTISTQSPDRSLASDSNTESEAEDSANPRVQRTKSFAKPKDQWHFRPEPEQLYENLDALFPKIDLDKPIVEGLSTPTTPSEPVQPPPVHPTRQHDSRLPQSPKNPTTPPPPPPQHPGRLKMEHRKSIRVVADFARRAIQRDNKGKEKDKKGVADAAADLKLERRKSSSMWDHQVIEVTPSKIANNQLPESIPEESAQQSDTLDGKPPILNWVKGELIGKGSYGRVYIALNVTTGDMMAVKQVELPANERDRHDSRQLGMIEALRGEIALLKDLYHPNIVQYLGTETSPEYLSIFLEYVPGGTIASIYRAPGQSPFEEQLVKYFTKQILEGLAYLHARNIMHRDMKGDNILVDANGICKISDFGISKQASDAYDSFGGATNMKGSVFWMAPEVIHSATERTYSGKVDIWGIGCVVLEMWTGSRPWGTMEQVAAMFELFNRRARPPLPQSISSQMSPVALDFLNEKCLAKDPRDRPTAKELLQHPFILDTDKKWTFANSQIGKAVASRGVRKMKAHHAAHASSASNG